MSCALPGDFGRSPGPSWLPPGLLGPRLAAVAAWVPAGQPLVDVGTDHARLPEALLRADRVPAAIGVDRAQAPLAAAQARLAAYPDPRLQLRLGDGLQVLSPGEAHTLTAAGLGGRSIAALLQRGDPRGLGISQLVLQVERDDPALRGALWRLGYAVTAERLAVDRRRCFLILKAQLSALPLPPLDPVTRWLGPPRPPAPVTRAWLGVRIAWLRARLPHAGPQQPELAAVVVAAERRLAAPDPDPSDRPPDPDR